MTALATSRQISSKTQLRKSQAWHEGHDRKKGHDDEEADEWDGKGAGGKAKGKGKKKAKKAGGDD